MTTKTQAWLEQQDRTLTVGHNTINRVITNLRKLADGLEHYRDAFNRSMWRNDYSAAKDHLQAAQRVLEDLVKETSIKLTTATAEVDRANHLRHEVQIESIKEKQA